MGRVVGIALALLALQPAYGGAQQLPGYQGPSLGELRSEWTMAVRRTAEASLQDWINLSERGEWEALSRFFTDRGVLADGSGRSGEGRGAVRDVLQASEIRMSHQTQISEVVAGNRIIYMTGRIRFEEAGGARIQAFTGLLENHRERWMFRMMALSPPEPAGGVALGSMAIRPTRSAVYPPRRTLVRLVAEPVGLQVTAPEEQKGFAAGGGLGVELDRVIEARAFAWREGGTETGDHIGYGGELRGFLTEFWRLRPYLAGGVGRFAGEVVPDTGWVPSAGVGLAVRVTDRLDLHLGYRASFVLVDDGRPATSWLTEKRVRRPLLGLGLSVAAGRPREWRDADPPELMLSQEATERPFVASIAGAWITALLRGDMEALAATQTPAATLIPAGEPRPLAATAAREFWSSAGAPRAAYVEEVGISGSVAYAVIRMEHDWYDGGLLVLHRTGDRWSVHTALVR